ncbi:DUF6153 family protein [Amycolatopsis sp. NPDC059021]|uniref:DUF6153 family protein n=1 Tax=Amycolatopsis sp. NPDC059021 TaxID=3346704 RepID=UPI00366DD3A9
MASVLSKTRQVLLLCALALGVIAMHHVSPANGMPCGTPAAVSHLMSAGEAGMVVATASESGHPGMPASGHELLHLCLAVMTAAALLALVLRALVVLSRAAATAVALTGPRGSPGPGRPPDDRRGRGVLTSLCVLRV